MNLTPALIETQELAAWSPADYIVLETDISPEAFEAGHIPGSVFWPMSDLLTPEFALHAEPEHFAALMSRSGITPKTTVVCAHNSDPSMAGWSAWLFWILTGFGHAKTVVLNGGTPKWQAEGRPLEAGVVEKEPSLYPLPANFDKAQRAILADVKSAVAGYILDARSEEEYRGEHFFNAPPKHGERAGRIPGSIHLPVDLFLHFDGTYKSNEELRDLGLDPESEAFTYCAVGIRSSLAWFALKHIFGLPNVRNYDGSWNEWSRSGSEVA